MMNAFDDVVRVHAQTHFVSKLRGIFKFDAQAGRRRVDTSDDDDYVYGRYVRVLRTTGTYYKQYLDKT